MQTSHKDIAEAISTILKVHDSDGYNVITKQKPDYFSLVLNELDVLEKFSYDYVRELRVISKFVRKNLFGNETDKNLYEILHRLNQVMKLFSDVIGVDIFWNCTTVMVYASLICKYEVCLIDKLDINKLIDDVQITNAKKIIDRQWNDVLNSDDGMKTFMRVFDDIFTTSIENEPDKYIYSLKQTDVLCRMVKEKDCDEQRFIPFRLNKYQNRWNPPGKTFLYLSYGQKSHYFNENLTLEEMVCLLECRTEPDTDCSFCKFQPTVPGRILNLSFNDVELSDYRYILENYEDKLISRILNKLFENKIKISRKFDKKYIYNKIKKETENLKIKSVVSESVTKQYLKLICSCIYSKVDGSEEEKEKQYHSFHVLAEYLQSKDITGIIYPCTRKKSLKGKNLVLFEPNDAKPIIGSIKRYHYNA